VRAALPEDHLSAETKDAVKVGMGLVATMAALVLGLLVASTKGAYDTQKGEVTQMAAKIVFLDRVLANYGSESAESRDLLRRSVGSAINHIWPNKKLSHAAQAMKHCDLLTAFSLTLGGGIAHGIALKSYMLIAASVTNCVYSDA